ncbi:GGDEF domain-containing protein [Prosthecomicrobium sp. N25]|uniref:GGDEF domain-containing protein n=1 Tax=Prosthecomicrobium sp. N25 TaxID=3129254 RepID=UPI003077EFA9
MDGVFVQDVAGRLHKTQNRRLLALWEAKAEGAGGPPPYAAFSPNELDVFADHLAVAQRTPGGDWAYLAYGRELVRYARMDCTGRTLAEIGHPVAGQIRTAYDEASGGRTPVLVVHESIKSHYVHSFERLVLPVAGPCGPTLVVQSVPLVLRQDLLESILQSGTAALFACSPVLGPDGTLVDLAIVVSNGAAATLVGAGAGEPVRGSLSGLIGNHADHDLLDYCALVLANGTPARIECECDIGGLRSLFEIAISRFDGGLTLMLSDLGELRRAYKELERQKAELVSANRLLETQATSLAVLARDMETARLALDEEIAQKNALEAELRRLASTDDLTGTMNRRAFLEEVRREVARSARYGNPVSLVALDLDRFKQINDGFGHAAGDEVLRLVAGALSATIRVGIDEIGRLGGEEFGVILPETGQEGALQAAERMRQAVEDIALELGGRPIPVSASFGVAGWRPDETIEGWMGRADAALYRAKSEGRNRVIRAEDPPLPAPRAA